MKIEYAIIVKNKTRLETLVERFNTRTQAKFYIERSGGDFSDYEAEHETFHRALTALQTNLSVLVKHKVVEREYLSSFIFSPNQLIIVIGQDGLVANTAKYSRELPIVAVNPDKKRYDGVLLPFDTQTFMPAVEQVMDAKFNSRTVRFAEARLNDGQRLLAFNELFIGVSGHVSARYKISYAKKTEEQSSSGLIVSTPAGLTGWMSSVFNMAYSVTGLFEKNLKPKRPKLNDDQLLFTIREPFISVKTKAAIAVGMLTEKVQLSLESLMPSGGIIFSDGIESDFLQFNSGAIATIGLANEKAQLVIGN